MLGGALLLLAIVLFIIGRDVLDLGPEPPEGTHYEG
jgi:hypothetical protein